MRKYFINSNFYILIVYSTACCVTSHYVSPQRTVNYTFIF